MTYVSMGKEVSTLAFIKWLFENGKKVSVPVVFGKNMKASYIDSLTELEKSGFGVPEPKKEIFKECKPEKINAIIVPGIAFDTAGHRIGYGAGYYDRYLPLTSAVKIGLCFDFCIVENAYAQPHDIPTDYILTDKKTQYRKLRGD